MASAGTADAPPAGFATVPAARRSASSSGGRDRSGGRSPPVGGTRGTGRAGGCCPAGWPCSCHRGLDAEAIAGNTDVNHFVVALAMTTEPRPSKAWASSFDGRRLVSQPRLRVTPPAAVALRPRSAGAGPNFVNAPRTPAGFARRGEAPAPDTDQPSRPGQGGPTAGSRRFVTSWHWPGGCRTPAGHALSRGGSGLTGPGPAPSRTGRWAPASASIGPAAGPPAGWKAARRSGPARRAATSRGSGRRASPTPPS